jgi:UPF0271 protein
MRTTIDLNCDLGESYGAWRMGDDEAVLPLISSANVACGFHGGDAAVMRRTVKLARAHGVAIGAHVSLQDLQGFGRREMRISADEAYELTLYQLGALHAFARAEGARVAHVKPHGALYNMAARDAALAAGIAAAVHDFDPALVLYGLAGSALPAAGVARGLVVAHEAFCDRAYESDGSLASRSLPGAVLDERAAAAAQLLALVRDQAVNARDGSRVAIRCDSICLHGDRPDAADVARHLRAVLATVGVSVAPPRA